MFVLEQVQGDVKGEHKDKHCATDFIRKFVSFTSYIVGLVDVYVFPVAGILFSHPLRLGNL